MSIAVDQGRLRRIVETILRGEKLHRTEVTTILEIAQLAAGVEPGENPAEHATLQAIAQHIGSMTGEKPGELLEIPQIPDEDRRSMWLRTLARQLETRAKREVAYALAYLVSVSDLALTPVEANALDEFQHALGLDYRRATDLEVFVSEVVAVENPAPPPWV